MLVGRLDISAVLCGHGSTRRHRDDPRVLEELTATPQTPVELVAAVYRDVPAAMHGFAQRSLLAHLIKLVREGRAVERGGRFATLR